MKIYISFYVLKKIRFVFNENTDQFLEFKKKKKSDMYLMKMQISFKS